MQRVKVTLVYRDDTKPADEVILRPLALVAAERHFRGAIPGAEGTLYAAWHQLGQPGTFADFLDSLEHAEDTAVPPTSATSSEPSPSSPSPEV
jgi:hypothetical protein